MPDRWQSIVFSLIQDLSLEADRSLKIGSIVLDRWDEMTSSERQELRAQLADIRERWLALKAELDQRLKDHGPDGKRG